MPSPAGTMPPDAFSNPIMANLPTTSASIFTTQERTEVRIEKHGNVVQVFFALTPKVPDQLINMIIQEAKPKIWLIRLTNGHPDCPTAGPIDVTVNEFDKTWQIQSQQGTPVQNRETHLFGDYEKLSEIKGFLYLLTDNHADERLRAVHYYKYGRHEFT